MDISKKRQRSSSASSFTNFYAPPTQDEQAQLRRAGDTSDKDRQIQQLRTEISALQAQLRQASEGASSGGQHEVKKCHFS